MKPTRSEAINNRLKCSERTIKLAPITRILFFNDYIVCFNKNIVISLFRGEHSIPKQVIDISTAEGTAIIEQAINSTNHVIEGSAYSIITPSGTYKVNIPYDGFIEVEGVEGIDLNQYNANLAEFNKRITDRMFPNQQNKTSKLSL